MYIYANIYASKITHIVSLGAIHMLLTVCRLTLHICTTSLWLVCGELEGVSMSLVPYLTTLAW